MGFFEFHLYSIKSRSGPNFYCITNSVTSNSTSKSATFFFEKNMYTSKFLKITINDMVEVQAHWLSIQDIKMQELKTYISYRLHISLCPIKFTLYTIQFYWISYPNHENKYPIESICRFICLITIIEIQVQLTW